MERDIAGGCGEVPVIVSAAVALTSLAALVARRLRQGLCLFSASRFSVGIMIALSNTQKSLKGAGCYDEKLIEHLSERYSTPENTPEAQIEEIPVSTPIASPYVGMSEYYINRTELGHSFYDVTSGGNGWSYTFLLDDGYALLVKTEGGVVKMIQKFKDGKPLSSFTETGAHIRLANY